MESKSPKLKSVINRETGIHTKPRFVFIDNVRIFVISLVVLHHLSITYGAPGGWYYSEGQPGQFASILLTLFVATNQAFFMGLLFFISAYFTPGSYNRKGARGFLFDRLKRLGIPLFLFFFILSPLTNYFAAIARGNNDVSIVEFVKAYGGFGFGPLWFVEALIYFALIYFVYRALFRTESTKITQVKKIPNNLFILGFASLIGLGTFVIRLWLPVGWSIEPLNLQFPHFLQYIVMLVLGVAAYKYRWLESLNYESSRSLLLFSQVMIFVLFPAIFYFGGASSGNIEPFIGGWHWQCFCYTMWEQLTGFALIVGVLGIFKEKFNKEYRFTNNLSGSSYGVYVFHAPLVVLITLGCKFLKVNLFLKFIILALPVVVFCFALTYFIRKLPGVKRIL